MLKTDPRPQLMEKSPNVPTCSAISPTEHYKPPYKMVKKIIMPITYLQVLYEKMFQIE